jgi:hypothetical protein
MKGEAMPGEHVFENLERALDRWCGIEGGSYGPGQKLVGLWVQAFGNARPYFPDGVDSLIEKIQDSNFFNPCSRAQSLTRTQFAVGSGSGIKTVGDLHDHLSPCV